MDAGSGSFFVYIEDWFSAVKVYDNKGDDLPLLSTHRPSRRGSWASTTCRKLKDQEKAKRARDQAAQSRRRQITERRERTDKRQNRRYLLDTEAAERVSVKALLRCYYRLWEIDCIKRRRKQQALEEEEQEENPGEEGGGGVKEEGMGGRVEEWQEWRREMQQKQEEEQEEEQREEGAVEQEREEKEEEQGRSGNDPPICSSSRRGVCNRGSDSRFGKNKPDVAVTPTPPPTSASSPVSSSSCWVGLRGGNGASGLNQRSPREKKRSVWFRFSRSVISMY
eukprot:jgi/Undpi1/8648/HiC_scaffold_25.g11113.m1